MTSLIHRSPSATSTSPVAPFFADRFPSVDRFFSDDFFRPMRLFDQLAESLTQRGWVPPVDIRETDEAYVVMADLPGFTKEDVEITLEDSVLTLTGSRQWDGAEQPQSYRRVERAYGEFSRSFNLPAQVDADQVKAKFDNGVLTVTVPKTAEARPRRIAVA